MSHTPPLVIESNADLQFSTTFRTAANAKQRVTLTDTAQLPLLAKHIEDKDFVVLGTGSNVLFADDYHGLVIVNDLRGQTIIDEDDNNIRIHIAAGEIWHDLVVSLTQRGVHGLENLALIPGTMGAAPVQNIGAYGVEIAEFIDSVSVFDFSTQQFETLSRDDCGFSYRTSHFKTDAWRKQYIITGVTLNLSKQFNPVLSYQGLCEPTPPSTGEELLNRVISIRQSKLPDPTLLANAGSFFKNPVITRNQLQQLSREHPDIPSFDIDDNHVKIPAAWLIQTVGFKGHQRDNGAGVYEKHALILINRGGAHGRQIYALACDIMDSVANQFNITISPEVRILGQ